MARSVVSTQGTVRITLQSHVLVCGQSPYYVQKIQTQLLRSEMPLNEEGKLHSQLLLLTPSAIGVLWSFFVEK